MWELAALFGVTMALGMASIYAWKHRAQRFRVMRSVAVANGMAFSGEDMWRCTGVPFELFRIADGSRAENVLVGRGPNGALVRVFDLLTYHEYDDGTTERSLAWSLGGVGERTQTRVPTRRYRRHSAAMMQLPIVLPHLVVQPETRTTRVLGRDGLRDINFESEEFNRNFTVTCTDERFAHLLLDPGMMDFLNQTEGEFQFETKGRWLLVGGSPVPPRQVLSLVGLMTHFDQRIPAIVRQEYTTLPEAVIAADVMPDLSRP